MSNDSQLAERPQSVKDFLALPAYKARFGEVLGQRAPQFMASLVTLTNDPNLAKCEPRSVIASAMIAAVLDFPIEKSLGFAHIVPYGNVAQFQMAAKGYVQLALRSGQYQRLNAKPVNAEAFGGYDEVGEPRILWELLDETKPSVGYAVAWKLGNGFTKVAYWTKEKVDAHGKKFSRAYAAGRKDSPWFTNFDKMAIKTVVMNELRAWGILSVQMQKAMIHDQAVHTDIDAEPEYIDNDAKDVTGTVTEDQPVQQRAAAPKRSAKGAAAVVENAKHMEAEIVPEKPAIVANKNESAEPDATKTATEAAAIAAKEAAQLAADLKAREAKMKEAAKAADPAPEPKPAEPAPAKAPTALKLNEEVVATCLIKASSGLRAREKSMSDPKPSVLATLESEAFTGKVMYIDAPGATLEGDNVKIPPMWEAGQSVRVRVTGRPNANKDGPQSKVLEATAVAEVAEL